MARIDIPPGDGEETARLFTHRPELGGGIAALGRAVYQHSRLREREVMRMRVAEINHCSV